MSIPPSFDLSLLPILLALHDARNVSMATQQLGMSQPGVGTALGKLHATFDGPLFVRASRGMEPMLRALALIPAAHDVLARVQQGILKTGVFDPATTTHTFSISLSDVDEMVFLPCIVEVMARRVPRALVQSVSLPSAQIKHALKTGSFDLVVGYFPDLKKNNFLQQQLFTHYFICIVHAGHPITHGGNTKLLMTRFLECGHAVVYAEGHDQELCERFLKHKHIRRKPSLLTPYSMSIPFILMRTDLIAMVPHTVGLSFMQSHTNICVMEPPLELPSSNFRQHWRHKFHNDTRNQWSRTLVSPLLSNEAGE